MNITAVCVLIVCVLVTETSVLTGATGAILPTPAVAVKSES